MEIMRPVFLFNKLFKQIVFVCMLLLIWFQSAAQTPVASFVVKKGNMYVALSKNLPASSLDSFIVKYDLAELNLKQVLKTNVTDTVQKLGWRIEKNDSLFVISKPLDPYEKIKNPADRIDFFKKHFQESFFFTNKEPKYGVNRFQNKHPFAVKDSAVTFFYRGNKKAGKVMLAGTFNNWKPDALPMQRVDSGWIAMVKLAPGKHYYKFIADDEWMIDKDNLLIENDGEGNDNSVYYKTNTVFATKQFAAASKVFVAGSFNNWQPEEIQLKKTTTGWEVPVYLADGTHTYRFIADGQWFTDDANPDRFPNEFKEYNSVKCMGAAHLFVLKGYTDAKRVVLMGSFNNWRNYELLMQKTDSGWILPYSLGHGNYEYVFEVDGKKVNQPGNKTAGGNSVLIIAPNYTFRLKGYANAKNVFLTGDFNDWSPNAFAMKREGNEWILQVHLYPGKHLYKFVVDDQWIIDPANKSWEENEFGTGNSVIWMKE
jgi:Glycogen recognition site of AMP-activated protein kinase